MDYLSPDNDPMDESSHGTRVAGIAAAVTDNGVGIAGVAPNAALMSLRAGVTLQSDFYLSGGRRPCRRHSLCRGKRGPYPQYELGRAGKRVAHPGRGALRGPRMAFVLVSSAGNTGESGLSYPGGHG